MGQTVKAPDGKTWVVRRLLLPAPVSAANLMGSAVESSGSQQTGSPLLGLLIRGILVAVIGVVLLPFAVLARMIFRRWTVEAAESDTTMRWKAKTWGGAGAGVEAVAGALDRGESLQGPLPGLTPL
jgi:hypothetical protein